MFDATIVVATYGSDDWRDLARTRAIPSAEQTGAHVVYVHGDTLAQARNQGIAAALTEWVICLDADDELAPGYLERMAEGSADVRAPSVEYVVNGRRRPRRVPKVAGHSHDCTGDCLPEGNWLVIGSAMRRDDALAVGGFREFPIYEDWALFLALYVHGATFEALPRAVYIAHHRSGSRNRSLPMEERDAVHHEIVRAVMA